MSNLRQNINKVGKVVFITIGVLMVINSLPYLVAKYTPQAESQAGKQEYIKACDTGEYTGEQFDQREYCECTYNRIIDKYSEQELARDGLNMTSEQMLTKYRTEYMGCIRAQGIEV